MSMQCAQNVFIGLFKTHGRPHLENAVQALTIGDMEILQAFQKKTVKVVHS